MGYGRDRTGDRPSSYHVANMQKVTTLINFYHRSSSPPKPPKIEKLKADYAKIIIALI